MVKNSKLLESACIFEDFVGMINENLDNVEFVYLLTQIIDLRLNDEKVQGEIFVYRKYVDGHIAEVLNFCDKTTLKLERLQKENENLRA